MADEQTTNEAAQTIADELGKMGVRPPRGIRNPFTPLVEKLVKPVAVQDVARGLKERLGSVRIALVSMPTFTFEFRTFSTMLDPMGLSGEHQDTCKRQLAAFEGSESDRMLQAYKDALTYAFQDLKANVVCVSELGLPSREMRPVDEAHDFARQMSDRYKALVVAGSVHDSRTLYNTAYVYYPGGVQTLHKGVSAASVGERICTPSLRQIPVVDMFGLKFATMICLDVADFASIASVVRCADRVDVLLVPCHTYQFERMRDIAKVASRALRGLVILVNIEQNEVKKAYVARFGNLLSLQTHALKSRAVVSWFDEDVDEFEKTRILLKNPSTPPPKAPPATGYPLDGRTPADEQIEWLFGIKEGPTVY